jgi:hypothetical protein
MEKLINKIKKIPRNYFSLADIRKISDLDDNSLKVALNRLVKNQELIKISHRLFSLDDSKINWEQLAVGIYGPSYLSFEWILAKNNILSQQPVNLTLATSKRSKSMETSRNIITYHHLRNNLFWGYEKNDKIVSAFPEKAFLDLAYLSLNGYAKFDINEMNLKYLDKKKIKIFADKFKSARLIKLLINKKII